MMERRQILDLWQQRGETPAILVTLTQATGSSYRRPGAHVLLLADGRHAGTISGGCLETEIARKAFWMTRNGALMQRYSTLFDDTAEIPFGLGCGGEIDILLEPADTPECAALLDAMRQSLAGESFTAITTLPAENQGLQRAILNAEEETVFATTSFSQESSAEKFIEALHPPQRLILFGAGDDAQPLAQMAAMLGWSVMVADGRTQLVQPQLGRTDRFPSAECILLDTALSIAPLRIVQSDAVILMTHSFAQDRALLAQLLPIAPAYLGVLGARHRSSLLVSEVAAALGWSISECAALLHAPTGLDLGGDSPESIALAILAEAHARTHNRTGNSRRISAGEMLEHLDNAKRAPAICALDSVVSEVRSNKNGVIPSEAPRVKRRGAAEGPASLPMQALTPKGK